MKKTFLATLAVVALALAGCAGGTGETGDSTETPGASGELTPVSIGAVVTTSTVPIYVALSEGIFEKHGLDVTLELTQNFAAAAPSLLNGQLDFATAATPPFIGSVAQGLPLQAVAGTTAVGEDPEAEAAQLVVRADSGITEIADLKGKTIATNAVGAGPYVGLLATYIRSGGALDDIEWVVMPLNEQLAALEAGTIDGATLDDPFTTMAVSEGHVALTSVFRTPGQEILEAGDEFVVVVGSTKFLQENPEVAAAMRAAIIEANEVAAANPELVVDLLISEADMAPEVAENLRLPQFIGVLTGNEVQRMADAMLDVGLLQQSFDGMAAVWQP